MAGLTAPIHLARYGSGDGDQPTAYPDGASQLFISGAVALVSGSGSVTAGYLKNPATTGTSDYVVGMLGDPAGGTFVDTSTTFTSGTVDGDTWHEVLTGSFFFQSGTGSDQLSAATNGKTVYYGGENANGPIACAVIGTPARPVLGTQIPQDPGIAGGSAPGSNYWPITVRPDLGRP
jgi:hypothetical protein